MDKAAQRSAAQPTAKPSGQPPAKPSGPGAGKPAAKAGAKGAGLGKPPMRITARPRRRSAVFPWRPAAIYVGIVVLGAIGLFFWERAYEAQFAPPSPDVLAKNLVQNVLGPGSVEAVRWDRKTDTVSMRVKDVVTEAKQTTAENRKRLSGEGTVAANIILQAVSFKHVVLTIVKDKKVEVTVRAEPGKAKTPQIDFAPGAP